MGEATLKLGASFQTVMFVNHIGGFVGGLCGLGYQFVAFNRALAEGLNPNYKHYQSTMISEATGTLEKTFELMSDAIYFSGHAAPAWLRIPVGLGIGITGVYKEWRKVE